MVENSRPKDTIIASDDSSFIFALIFDENGGMRGVFDDDWGRPGSGLGCDLVAGGALIGLQALKLPLHILQILTEERNNYFTHPQIHQSTLK